MKVRIENPPIFEKREAPVDHEQLRAWIATYNEEALLADGFEDAIVGIAERCSQNPLVVYDAEKCIKILMDRDGMDEDEAQEFFNFNTLGAWMGEHTPLFLTKYEPEPPAPTDEWPVDFPREVGE